MGIFTKFRRYVTQFVCPDNYDDGDYQEVETEPPQSVLDVYRQMPTIGHFGSQGPNVLDQLTA